MCTYASRAKELSQINVALALREDILLSFSPPHSFLSFEARETLESLHSRCVTAEDVDADTAINSFFALSCFAIGVETISEAPLGVSYHPGHETFTHCGRCEHRTHT